MRVRSAAGLDAIDRDALIDSTGRTLKELRATLTPRWGIVWRDLLAGHAALAAAVAVLAWIQSELPPPVVEGRFAPGAGAAWLGAALLGALSIGYVVAYIQLFFHEAAHFLVARDRKLNDRLANLFIGSIVGMDIKAYRPIHFDHHRFLGTPQDTERMYFDPLNWRFVVESLTGVKVVKVMLHREKASAAERGQLNRQLVLGVLLNAALLGTAVYFELWLLSCAWLLGMAVAYPFFVAIRQVLEHRSFLAGSDSQYYRSTEREPTTRLFGDGILASTLGGAGFNRHLLHHWDPQVSYTRLRDLEAFLADTQAAAVLETHRATYRSSFLALMRSN